MQINYDTKCSKELFAEILTRELAKYDKDEETLASFDGIKFEEVAVGEARSMVDNDYLVVISLLILQLIVLASLYKDYIISYSKPTRFRYLYISFGNHLMQNIIVQLLIII